MKTELRLLQDTGSPSGRYAVAWGVPGVSRLDAFVGAGHVIKDTFPYEKVRNYLVEKRSLQIIGTIPLHTRRTQKAFFGMNVYKEGGNDWHGMGDSGKNHSTVSTFWNPSEDWAVVLHGGKWWYNAVYLCHRQATEFKFIEIGDQVEDFVRAYLLRTRRAAYVTAHHHDRRNPYVGVNTVKVAPPHLALGVFAGIPKDEHDPLALNATLTLKIHNNRSGLALSPVNLKITR